MWQKIKKFKKNSLVTEVWSMLTIFSIILIAFIWIFQIVFLDNYYKYSKTKEIKKAAYELKKDYSTNKLKNLETIAMKHGICIEIYGNNKYKATYFNHGCLEFGNKKSDIKSDFIKSGLSSKQYNLINYEFKNETLVYAIKLNNKNYAFLNASLVSLDRTIPILQNQLLIITVVVLALAFIIGYFFSKKISKPISKISKDAKKLSEGNYNITFSSDENIYEINELVDTLNHTTKELSETEELKRDLMANVSHDLKTPLTMIKAYAEMVRDLTYNNKEKRESNLNTIINETDRLNLLVNDILDLSALQSSNGNLTYESFDLIDIIKQILSRFDILSQKEDYKFILNAPDLAKVYADKKRIYQVIYNLINNAINYTGPDKKVTINVINNPNEYKIEICDTGKGIPKEEIKIIWDKYYHNKKKHKRNEYGSGIGLSIVKNILQNHNFKYGVNSSNKGSIFYFEIPKTIEK